MAVFQTAASADDASEPTPSGTVSLALDGQQTVAPWPRIRGDNIVAFRFPSVNIAQGTAIGSASFTFDQLQNYTGLGNLGNVTLFGQAIDNAPQFAVTSGDISGRATTTASVAGSTIVDGPGGFPVNVTAIVQEILNRAGWVSGNAIVIIFKGNGTGSTNFAQPYMWDYFSGTVYHAKLTINLPSSNSKPRRLMQAIKRAAGW